MNSPFDEKITALQGQVKKLQSQKDTLLKELDTVEERFEKMNRMYRKSFPIIIDSVAIGEDVFSNTCKDLSQALKKGESEGRIAYILDQLKTAVLKEEFILPGGKQKKGLLSVFKKKDPFSFIDDYKQSYQEVVNSLRSKLDEKYSGKLDSIAAGIKTAGNPEDIGEIRETVFSLIFGYISETNQDRAKVNAFVQEVVGKILDIESNLDIGRQHTDTLLQTSNHFESVLESELKRLKQTSGLSSNLDLLKVQVAERLAVIENALQKKQAKDKAIREHIEKERQLFKTGFTKLKQDLDEATRYSEELEKKLNLDQLTGAFNRRAYDKKMEDEMARFFRYGTGFSLLLMDADHFKSINDQYGHAIGDKCLQEIIKRTLPLLRQNDMLSRYGGEEFVVVMPETDLDGGREVAEKIRQTIEKLEFIYKTEKVKVTVSVGVSQAREGDKHPEEVFERADIAVYQAKANGRNQVIVN